MALQDLCDWTGGTIEGTWDLGSVLGWGSTSVSVVQEATNRSNGQKYALKVLLNEDLQASDKEMQSVASEVRILRKLQHPNIITLQQVIGTPTHTFLVMELFPGMPLMDMCAMNPMREDQAKDVFSQILEAINFLHSRSVAHLDIKPENVLVAEQPNGSCAVKLVGFGFAAITEGKKLTGMRGTPLYAAPEVASWFWEGAGTAPCPPVSYGCAADIWSLGVTLFVMLTGEPPFDASMPEEDLLSTVCNAVIDFGGAPWLSGDAKSLMLKLLQADPKKRAGMQSIGQHAWLEGCCSWADKNSKAAPSYRQTAAKDKPEQNSNLNMDQLDSALDALDAEDDSD